MGSIIEGSLLNVSLKHFVKQEVFSKPVLKAISLMLPEFWESN